MNERRLNYLAYNNPVNRRIVARKRNAAGHWEFQLECGHDGAGCVGHMDASGATEWACHECSVANVRTHPRWAAEFKAVTP